MDLREFQKRQFLGGDANRNGEITLNHHPKNQSNQTPKGDCDIKSVGYALLADGMSRDLKEGFEMVKRCDREWKSQRAFRVYKKDFKWVIERL